MRLGSARLNAEVSTSTDLPEHTSRGQPRSRLMFDVASVVDFCTYSTGLVLPLITMRSGRRMQDFSVPQLGFQLPASSSALKTTYRPAIFPWQLLGSRPSLHALDPERQLV